uniref:Spermatogenesis associated 3 n=1 Tax=Neovison vison TaxID=452646 RepID=A0A8C7A4Q7_NEOVI
REREREEAPGAGPSRAPQDRKAESQQQARAQTVEGHGRILLFGELWRQDEDCLTVCATRQRKRPGNSGWDGADCPAAKSRRCAAEPPPSGGWVPCPAPQRSPRLLLVLCRASALRSNLPRLQLLLQQVHARHRQPPAALVGIVVQPRPEEEAEARRRMETLLCSAFAPHRPSVEVHTAVFRPSRSDCALDVQPAASTGRNARARAGPWERPGLPALLACFSWGPWSRGKDPDATSPSDPAQDHLQDTEEELALTAICPNGDCEDHRKGSRACDGLVPAPADPAVDSR